MSSNRGNDHSAKTFNVAGAIAGTVVAGTITGAVVAVALAPVVIPAALSIAGASAIAGKLPPQVDQLVKYHLSP